MFFCHVLDFLEHDQWVWYLGIVGNGRSSLSAEEEHSAEEQSLNCADIPSEYFVTFGD